MAARKASTRGELLTRIALALLVLGVIIFAVQGGEWGTLDLVRQQSGLVRARHDVDSLRHEVDSLKKYKQAVLTDPITQERIAREEFGMVKGDKEMLYRFTETDSAGRKMEAGSRKPEAGGNKPDAGGRKP